MRTLVPSGETRRGGPDRRPAAHLRGRRVSPTAARPAPCARATSAAVCDAAPRGPAQTAPLRAGPWPVAPEAVDRTRLVAASVAVRDAAPRGPAQTAPLRAGSRASRAGDHVDRGATQLARLRGRPFMRSDRHRWHSCARRLEGQSRAGGRADQLCRGRDRVHRSAELRLRQRMAGWKQS